MISLTPVLLLAGYLASSCSAWLPSQRIASPHDNDSHRRWLPTFNTSNNTSNKIRGVNLGSLFVLEPWMAYTAWTEMGCGSTTSEFDCVGELGQEAANAAFQSHWASWITQDDLRQISDLGLNTVRVPIGFWMHEDLVYGDSEHFPQGGFAYLEQLVGWAADLDIFVVLDLHGSPGAQVAGNPDTGQTAPTPGFYVSWEYERAYGFLEWITNITHTNDAFRTVGVLEIVNEPIQDAALVEAQSMVSTYYPTAMSSIRGVEDDLNVADADRLHVQMMDEGWGSGDPNSALTDLTYAAYDSHVYLKYDPLIALTRDAYLAASCNDDVGINGNSPLIVGEWTLSPATSVQASAEFDVTDNAAWYGLWWAAQVMAYEKQEGWIFWSWKADHIGGLDDWRWSYQAAVAAGVIPTDPSQAYDMDACAGVTLRK